MRSSPAAERNKQPILDVLNDYLESGMRVLEVASGVGVQLEHFANAHPEVEWQPSEFDREKLAFLADRFVDFNNVRQPLRLDASSEWQLDRTYDLIIAINMIHISPIAAARGLFRNSEKSFNENGKLITYGPYFVKGIEPGEGNINFDADLRRRNPEWGIRQLDDLEELAEAAGLKLEKRIAMPANNFTMIWGRR